MNLQDIDGDDISVAPSQIRAARALLGWSRVETAQRCGLGRSTLARIERGESEPRDETYRSLVVLLRDNGVLFLNDGQVLGVAMSMVRPTV